MHLGVALLTPGAILPKFRIQRFFSNVIELFSYCVIQDNENIKKNRKAFSYLYKDHRKDDYSGSVLGDVLLGPPPTPLKNVQ